MASESLDDAGANLLSLDNQVNLIGEKMTSRMNEEEEVKEENDKMNVAEEDQTTETAAKDDQEQTSIPVVLDTDTLDVIANHVNREIAEIEEKKEDPTEEVEESEAKNLAEVSTNEDGDATPDVNLMILDNPLSEITERVQSVQDAEKPESEQETEPEPEVKTETNTELVLEPADLAKQLDKIIGEPTSEEAERIVDPEIKEKVDEIAASVLTEEDLLEVNMSHIISEVVKESETFSMTAGVTRTDEEDDYETPKKKKKKVEEEPANTYPEEELKEAFELFEKKRTLPAYLMRDSVLDYARRQTVKFMVVEDYDSASKNDSLVAELIREYSKDSGGYDTETLARTLKTRIEQANERNQSKHKRYSERIAAIKQSEQSKIDKLLEQQEQEREQFEADCYRSEFLQRFSKPSIRLLQLRRIQKSLALAHKFEEAKSVKLEGDRLQRQETLEAQYRAIQHIKKAYAQLIERQEQQLDCAVLFGQRKVRSVEDESIKEKEAHNNLTKQLETKLRETKSKRSSLPPLQSSGTKMPQSKATRNQLMKYKKSPDVTLLNVKLTNLKSVMTMKPPSALRPVKI